MEYRAWTGEVPEEFARFWYAMLEESGLLGSGVVADWQVRLREHFSRELEAKRMGWFVALDGGRIVGTAAAFLHGGPSYIFKDRAATLAGIYVLPRYRRRGIARELTQRAVAWCREQGCASVRLRASTAGRPLYESLGFHDGDEMVLTLV
ncbi:MAG TPA: GNAT family N-acetyltransferase [Candidatus Baltobacteraceae bacterium]|jgi:GNAT superfamily N-acetyltransferase|nr:GNAT family N-acetyltransferase [Candidatus Baltobacteraceae bacterium]